MMPEQRSTFALLKSFLGMRSVLFFAVAAFTLFHAYAFIVVFPALDGLSGGLSILDKRVPFLDGAGVIPWHDESAAALLDGLGETGRHEYLSFVVGLDLIFSTLISPIFFMALLVRLYAAPLFIAGALPGFFDTVENLAITRLLVVHSEQSTLAATVGSFATAVKFACLLLVIVMLVVGVLRSFPNLFRHQRSNGGSSHA